MLETLANGAIIFDRFDTEVENKPAEVIFCFVPGNAMTPFVVWHRWKSTGALFWGHYHPGNEHELAMSYFRDTKNGRKRSASDKFAVVTPAATAAQ